MAKYPKKLFFLSFVKNLKSAPHNRHDSKVQYMQEPKTCMTIRQPV